MKKILNKRKIRGVVKYLVKWKKFIVEYDSWERERNLENVKKVVTEFKERLNIELKK